MRRVDLANWALRTLPKFTKGLNISSIRVLDQIRDPEIPITLRPLCCPINSWQPVVFYYLFWIRIVHQEYDGLSILRVYRCCFVAHPSIRIWVIPFTLSFLLHVAYMWDLLQLSSVSPVMKHLLIKGTGIPRSFSRFLSDILIWETCISISIRFQMTGNNIFLAVSPAVLIT